jgi:hypothetical protein
MEAAAEVSTMNLMVGLAIGTLSALVVAFVVFLATERR